MGEAAAAAGGSVAYQPGPQQHPQQHQEQLLLELLEKQLMPRSSGPLYTVAENTAAALAFTPPSSLLPPLSPELHQLSPQLHPLSPQLHPLSSQLHQLSPLSHQSHQLSPQLRHPSPEEVPAAITNTAAATAGMVMDGTTGMGGFGAVTAAAGSEGMMALPLTDVNLQQLLQQMLLQEQQQEEEEEERSWSLPLVFPNPYPVSLPPASPLQDHQQQQQESLMINISSSRSGGNVSNGYLLSDDQLSNMFVRQMQIDQQQQQQEMHFQAQHEEQQQQELMELLKYKAQLQLELDQTLQAMQQIKTNSNNSELSHPRYSEGWGFRV